PSVHGLRRLERPHTARRRRRCARVSLTRGRDELQAGRARAGGAEVEPEVDCYARRATTFAIAIRAAFNLTAFAPEKTPCTSTTVFPFNNWTAFVPGS